MVLKNLSPHDIIVIDMRKIKIKEFFSKILEEIFVDKYNCIACDRELKKKSSLGLCEECKDKLSFIEDRICKKCGRMQLDEADYCTTCKEHKREFDVARSCVIYDDAAKEIVRGLKFGGKKYLAKYVANFLVERYEDAFKDKSFDIVIPVPLTKKRKKSRRYNQSWEIAKVFANKLGLTADEGIVEKIKETQEQAKLSGKEREANVVGAFEVKEPEKVKDKSVLIIDDVMTTGSTASEIAKVLKKSGASNVYLLTFASTKYKVPDKELDSKLG